MCDKMIEQHLRTSHGNLDLSDVTRVQLQQEGGGGGGRAIALQTGAGKHVKEMVIVPEEQREFLAWTRNIKVSEGVKRSTAWWGWVQLVRWREPTQSKLFALPMILRSEFPTTLCVDCQAYLLWCCVSCTVRILYACRVWQCRWHEHDT